MEENSMYKPGAVDVVADTLADKLPARPGDESKEGNRAEVREYARSIEEKGMKPSQVIDDMLEYFIDDLPPAERQQLIAEIRTGLGRLEGAGRDDIMKEVS